MKCEACQVECADGYMYANHLKGKRHRYADICACGIGQPLTFVSFKTRNVVEVRRLTATTLNVRTYGHTVTCKAVNVFHLFYLLML